ncbi:MAG: pilus assembly protein [Lachnospiraceae bacterium]|nr:pilus assembly protein [Lachnospiraceae bacterium]
MDEEVYLDGSMTIEAAMVFSLIILVIEAVIFLGFLVYKESVSAIVSHDLSNVNNLERFRKIEEGEEVFKDLSNWIRGR